MQALVQDGKYQVHKILAAKDGYEAVVCINVESQNYYEPILLNVYKDSQYIRQYLKLFYICPHLLPYLLNHLNT